MFKVLLKWRDQKKYKKYRQKHRPLYKKIAPNILLFLFAYAVSIGYFYLTRAEYEVLKINVFLLALMCSLFSICALFVSNIFKGDSIKFYKNHIYFHWLFKENIKYENIKAFYIYEMMLENSKVHILLLDLITKDRLVIRFIEINDAINHDHIRAIFNSKGIKEKELPVSFLHNF